MTTPRALALALAPALVLAAADARAEERPAPRSIAVTLSPIHLVMPIVEATVEARVADRVGLAGIVGIGSIKSGAERFSAYEVGAQGRFYALGGFERGLHLGAELLYVHVSTMDANVRGTGAGLAVGPFAGYKHTWAFGLVAEAQLGVQVMAIRAEAEGSTAEDKGVIPLLNLNVGWSF